MSAIIKSYPASVIDFSKEFLFDNSRLLIALPGNLASLPDDKEPLLDLVLDSFL
ncbi:MAG: hypothetical protein ACOX5T_02410 [Candidatus Cryptobacteroides sp.]|jgi:hypothetical protein